MRTGYHRGTFHLKYGWSEELGRTFIEVHDHVPPSEVLILALQLGIAQYPDDPDDPILAVKLPKKEKPELIRFSALKKRLRI